MSARHHVVIGDGLVALEFVAAASLSPGDRLSVIGPQVAQFGRGVAYADEPADALWRYAFLLNSPSDALDPDFVLWMRDRWAWIADAMRGRRPDWLAAGQPYLDRDDIGALNVPRRIYGDYLREQAEATLAGLRRRGVHVDLTADRVTGLEPGPQGLALTLGSGRVVQADSVDVATGGPANQRLDGDDGPASYPCLFGHEQEITERLKPGMSVCCIGANATMLDVLRLCQCVLPERDIRFTAVSTAGRLPAALYAPYPFRLTEPDIGGPYETAAAFLAAMRREIDRASAAGDGVAELRGGFRKVFMEQGLSRFLPDPAEARQVTGPIKDWLLGGTRDAIEDFDRMMADGQTRLVAARVRGIEYSRACAVVICEQAGGVARTIAADIVINCAGPGRSFNFDPLTRSMIDRGWISVCGVSNGLEVGEDCRTTIPGLRHLSPATTVIGDHVFAMPLYDAGQLRQVLRGLKAPAG